MKNMSLKVEMMLKKVSSNVSQFLKEGLTFKLCWALQAAETFDSITPKITCKTDFILLYFSSSLLFYDEARSKNKPTMKNINNNVYHTLHEITHRK